jgi:GAF domain-containing protein
VAASTPPQPADDASELRRVEALYRLGVLDTPSEALLDGLTRSAAAACATPVAMLNLVDGQRQWTKSQVGLPGLGDLPLDESICAVTVRTGAYLEIPDTRLDPRVAAMACVRGEPALLFYAAAPLVTADGLVIGTLAVLDTRPRGGTASA